LKDASERGKPPFKKTPITLIAQLHLMWGRGEGPEWAAHSRSEDKKKKWVDTAAREGPE